MKISASDMEKRTDAGREIEIEIKVQTNRMNPSTGGIITQTSEYYSQDDVISLKIVEGQTTGGYTLGGAYSAQLTAKFTENVKFPKATSASEVVYNTISVTVYFYSGSHTFEASTSFNDYTVDTVKIKDHTVSVTAYDSMFFKTKEYKGTTYSFPTNLYYASFEACRGKYNILSLSPIKTSQWLNSSEKILEVPIVGKDKDTDTTQYYTQRDIISYIAALNGGSAYVYNGSTMKFSTPRKTNYTIPPKQVLSVSIGETGFKIDKIVLNTTGSSMTNSEDFTEGTIEFSVPFALGDATAAENTLNSSILKGLTYDAVTLKKQGTGGFEMGDLVDFEDVDGTVYHLLVMGIVYDFTGGFFSETLYSLAKSPSQQMYTGAGYVAGTGVGVYGTGAGWGNNTGWGAGGGIGGGGSSSSGGGTLRKADRARALQTEATPSGSLGGAPAMFITGNKNWSNQYATSKMSVSAGFSTSVIETTDDIFKDAQAIIFTEGLQPKYSNATFPRTDKCHSIIRVMAPDTAIPYGLSSGGSNHYGICATLYTSGERENAMSAPDEYEMTYFAQTNIGDVSVSYNQVGNKEPNIISNQDVITKPWAYELGSSYYQSANGGYVRLLYGGGIELFVDTLDGGFAALKIRVAGDIAPTYMDGYEAKIPLSPIRQASVSEAPTTKIASVEKAAKADNTAENGGANITYSEDGIHIEYKGHKKFIPWD